MSNNNSSSSGVGVVGLLGVAFVVLKLTEVINWSWWYVTLPFWGGLVIAILLILILLKLRSNEDKKRRAKRQVTNDEFTGKTKSKFQQRLEDMQKQQLEQRSKNR